MSLEKQTVSVPLVEGISEQDDAWAHDPPGFVALTEARWNRDKQIGKRHGQATQTGSAASIRGVAVSNAKAPNQIVDLDGVPHVLTADGTARRDPATSKWAQMSLAAPCPARVTSDPIVRSQGTALRSDVAVIGNIACVTWDTIGVGGSPTLGWYQFFDVSGDVPRPLCPPSALIISGGASVAARVVAIDARYFLVAAFDAPTGARNLYASSYDTTLGTYTFPAGTLVDAIAASGSLEFALDPSVDQNAFCYIAYHVTTAFGGQRLIRKLSNAAATIAFHALQPGSPPTQLVHATISGKSSVYVIAENGFVDVIDAPLAGASTQFNPFTAPAVGFFDFRRAAIGIDSLASNQILAIRSTSEFAFNGGNVITQMVQIDATNATVAQSDLGGCSLATLCSLYDPNLLRTYYGLTGQQAWHTQDMDPVNPPGNNSVAYRAAPVVQICQTISSGLGPQVVARVGQDAFDMLGNDGNLAVSHVAVRCPHITSDLHGPISYLCAYTVRMADMLGGAIGSTFHRGVDMATIRTAGVTPARNAAAQSIRMIGSGHGTSCIDGVLHAELSMPGVEWLDFVGFDATIANGAWAFTGSVPPQFQDHIDYIDVATWSPGPNPNRQWGFVLVWRYTDQRGNIHRGPPSSILWSIFGDLEGAGNHPAFIGFYPVSPTAILGDLNVTPEMEVYGCPPDGNGDFRSLGIVRPKADPACSGRLVVAITHNAASAAHCADLSRWDETVPVPHSLYTGESAGSELASVPSPALLSLCSTQSRLWGLSAEDRLDVWYTKPIALGFAPEWNDTLRVRIPQDGGPSVAIAALDDKVVVFKQSKVFVIEGDGGDASGSGSSLRPPRLISSDVGCVSVESVVEGPFGVVFLSQRGFMVLGRDLAYQFVGDRVIDQLTADSEDQVVRQVIAAALIPYDAEVRFALGAADTRNASRRVLVWNYRFNRWTLRKSNAPTFLALVGDAEWSMVVGSPSVVLQETPSDWSTTLSALSAKTSWVKFNGIAGFGRLRRAVFVLRWYSGGVSIQCAQDYAPTTETTRAWSATEMAALAVNGIGSRVELAVHPLVQKCESVQFILTEDTSGPTPGRGFELVGVTCEVGVKNGAFKRLSAAARK